MVDLIPAEFEPLDERIAAVRGDGHIERLHRGTRWAEGPGPKRNRLFITASTPSCSASAAPARLGITRTVQVLALPSAARHSRVIDLARPSSLAGNELPTRTVWPSVVCSPLADRIRTNQRRWRLPAMVTCRPSPKYSHGNRTLTSLSGALNACHWRLPSLAVNARTPSVTVSSPASRGVHGPSGPSRFASADKFSIT
jgi:hypothetical protein